MGFICSILADCVYQEDSINYPMFLYARTFFWYPS